MKIVYMYIQQHLAFISFYLLDFDFIRYWTKSVSFICVYETEKDSVKDSCRINVCVYERICMSVSLPLCACVFVCVKCRFEHELMSFSFVRQLEPNRCVIYQHIYSSRSGRFDFFVRLFMCVTHYVTDTQIHIQLFNIWLYFALYFIHLNSFNKNSEIQRTYSIGTSSTWNAIARHLKHWSLC